MPDWIKARRELVKQWGLLIGIFLSLVWIHEPSRYYFFGDSWDTLRNLLLNYKYILKPHNEHFIPIFKAACLTEYEIFGGHHLGYAVLLLAMHAFAALFVYRIGRRLDLRPGLCVAAALIFAFSTAPWEVTDWSFEQQFAFGIALGLASTDSFLASRAEPRALLRSALLSLIGFWWGGPIVAAFPLTLTAYWIYVLPKMERREKEMFFEVFSSLWGPPVIYFLSFQAAKVYNARVLAINVAPIVPHVRLRDFPSMIDFSLYGALNGVVVRSLTFIHPEALQPLSAMAILIVLAVILVISYRRFTCSQTNAFWFLTLLFWSSYPIIAIGRIQFGVDEANAPRYQYLPMAALALLIVLCWDGLRREIAAERTPYWWYGVSVLLLGYYLAFHSMVIRQFNLAADRGDVARKFLKVARQATYPAPMPPGTAVLGPELPVPFEITPSHLPVWMIFQVLDQSTTSVVPVADYLSNENALAPFNLVRNGGFDASMASDWIALGGAQIVESPAAAHSGQSGASLVLPPNAAISQNVLSNCSSAGRIFTFAIETKTAQPGALAARIIFKDVKNTILDTSESQPHPGDSQWHQLVISGLSPPGACVVGVDLTNEAKAVVAASADDALLVLHPGTVDASGKVVFQRPDLLLTRH